MRETARTLGRRMRALLAGVLAAAAAPAAAEPVTVFAAASLTDAMQAVAERFEAETGHDVAVSLAGTSALARQIEQGAPADVFVSANPGWMDRLEGAGLIAAGTRIDLLGNRLVLVASGRDARPVDLGPGTDLAGRLGDGRMAMALVDAVPAGIYGKAALSTLGLWESVAPKVAQTDNVRAALALVASGAAPFGVVYATDAAAEDDVTRVATFPADSHPPIVYPAAAVAGGDTARADAFLRFLRGPSARAAFEARGFAVLAD